ncbi:hypothetical protein CF319_g4167 [Tilletia indica]|nr:hypothetical protein CF319_g4167 [Tilletia indica]KAE8230182.1 hypothetical protein CF326_g4822 [Tilletia indica]
MADAPCKDLGGAYVPSEPSDQDEVFQHTEIENLHQEIENLRDGFRQFRRAIMVLGQSGIAALGLQYVDVGFKYLDIALVRRLQSPMLSYHGTIRQILSLGLQTTLAMLNAERVDKHGEGMLKYVQDDSILPSCARRQHVHERYASYTTVNDEQERICAGLYDFLVGLSQFQPAIATMPFISDDQDFEKIRAGVKEIRDYIRDGCRCSEQKEDPLAQLAHRLRALTDSLNDFAKNDITETKKRNEEEELKRIQQDGVLITLMAGVAAQSVAFVLPVSSTRPDLDTITSMLLLSAIVFAVCGVLAQASAHRRLTSTTALPMQYMRPKYITALAHQGQAFGCSYNLTVLFTVAGLTCFAWMKLHPAKAPEDYQPPFIITAIFFTIFGISALGSLLVFIIQYAWHRYEVYYSDSERMEFDHYAKTAREVDDQSSRKDQIPYAFRRDQDILYV